MEKIELSEKEIVDITEIQKEMIESIGRRHHKYNDEKMFQIFSIAISVFISNMMVTFGVGEIDDFLDDMKYEIKRILPGVKENSGYMSFKNGKKIREGKFN